MQKYIQSQLKEISDNLLSLREQASTIEKIVDVCVSALKKGHKIIFCGNGGSAAQSQHLAAELVGRYKMERVALNAISLTTDTSNITAIANDYGYDVVFSRQLEGVGQPGDVLIGLSTSGFSKNILNAFEMAKRKQITCVALTGGKVNPMGKQADLALQVPSLISAHIQEMHITVGHLICDLIEKEIYG